MPSPNRINLAGLMLMLFNAAMLDKLFWLAGYFNQYLAKCLKKVYFLLMHKFEFDPNKSDINLAKHGIDFVEAQQLWQDPDLLEIPALITDEPRTLIIARLNDKHWSAVITYRIDRIRIISVRRSRKNEVELYESF